MVDAINGFSGIVNLSAENLPQGITIAFSPASARTTSTLELSLADAAVAGTYNIRVAGVAGRNDVTVLHTLTNPKYNGVNVWYRHTQRLHTTLKLVNPQLWIEKPRAFPPIVDRQTFERAQATIQKIRDSHWSAEKVLKKVRRLLVTKGRLSERLILDAEGTPSLGTIRKYFGTQRMYEALNCKPEVRHAYRVDQARRSTRLRKALCDRLTTLFPDNVEIFLSRRGARSLLRIDSKFMVSVLFCRREIPVRRPRYVRHRPLMTGACWGATPPPAERNCITLICLLQQKFDRILAFYLANRMGDRAYIRLRRNSEFLRQCIRLDQIQDFYKKVTKLWEQREPDPSL